MDLQTQGGPKPLYREYARDRRWLDAHLDELVAKYPDKWVAILNEQVVAVGNDMGEVGREVDAKYPRSEPVIWLAEETINVYAHLALLS
jgi:hypothetical protein